MRNNPGPSRPRQALVVVSMLIGLIVVGIVIYSIYLERLAAQVISSVRDVSSTADAERVIANWRNRRGQQFWHESDRLGGDHNYDAQIDNTPLARLHIFEPTGITVGFTTQGGELRSAVVIMTTGRKPNTTSSVWVQEWFEPDSLNRMHVVEKDKPWRATVEFSAGAPRSQRERAFAFSTRCLVRLWGCKSAEDILPAVWQLSAPTTGKL
jgi:hypothetical protein